jgi:hypothetical protein
LKPDRRIAIDPPGEIEVARRRRNDGPHVAVMVAVGFRLGWNLSPS